MISFTNILKEVLTEWVSFASMYKRSEPGRKQRGQDDVSVKPMRVLTMDQKEAWAFSYKSDPSTTGKRWHGYIQFNKANVAQESNAGKLKCMVDCDCPDYRYRYAYNNAQAGAGRIGKHPDWRYGNDNNGQKWRPRSQGGVGDYGVGMCKHLCALAEFLNHQVSPDAPEPEDPAPVPKKKPTSKKSVSLPPAQKPQTTKAPEPPADGGDDDSYTDSRTGSDTMQEYSLPQPLAPGQRSLLYERFEQFVSQNPQFTVMYEADTH